MKNFIKQPDFIHYFNEKIKEKKEINVSSDIQMGYILEIIFLIYNTRTKHSVFWVYSEKEQKAIFYYHIIYEK